MGVCPPGAVPEPLGRELGEDGVLGRELVTHPPLVPELLAVGDDDEVAAVTLDEADLRVRMSLFDPGGQTGRLRSVVSTHAVLDADLHGRFGVWVILGAG